jgi:anti-anti-sigma factor
MAFHRPPTRVVEEDAGVAVITLLGEHDLASAAELEHTIASVSEGNQGIVVDLTATDFIDSTILHALVQAHRSLGDRFALEVATTTHVRRLLEVTGLEEVLPCAPTREEAVRLVREHRVDA